MTDEEIKKIDEEEKKETERTIAIILLLFVSLRKDLGVYLATLFGRHAVNGKLDLRLLAKSLDAEELVEFNKRYNTNYKRLSRLSALEFLINFRYGTVTNRAIELVEDLGKTIIALEEAALETTVESLDDVLFTKWGADNINFLERISAQNLKSAANLAVELKRKFGVTATLKDILDALDERVGIAERALKNLVVSEASAFGTNAQRDLFKKLGIKRYKYYALDDERTCDECGELHGKVFYIGDYEIGVTAPPIHRCCRCRIETVDD